MAEIVKICGVAILCAVVGAVIGNAAGGISTAVRLAGLALTFGGAVAILGQTVSELETLVLGSQTAEYVTLMLRGLGIAVLSRICSDVCRDCGHGTIASVVESAGKLCMILLAMPLVGDILEYANALLEKI